MLLLRKLFNCVDSVDTMEELQIKTMTPRTISTLKSKQNRERY